MLRNRPCFSVVRYSFLEQEDSDIKIFSGSTFSKKAPMEDEEAAEFMRERDNGNIEKAKELGRILAEKVATLSGGGDPALFVEQKKVLYGYACKKVIEANCSSSLLARSAIGAFLKAVQAVSQSDFDTIQDSVAFTKYMLAEKDDETGVGAVFAKLCGDKANASLICEGDKLYSVYCSECTAAYNDIAFV